MIMFNIIRLESLPISAPSSFGLALLGKPTQRTALLVLAEEMRNLRA